MSSMGWQEAQGVLIWISTAVGIAGFSASMLWHLRPERRQRYDWVERVARSAFVYLQTALWGTVLAFVILANFFDVNFGGVK